MSELTLNELFPAGSRVLLSGTGRDFVGRLGIEAIKHVVHGVLLGENIRTQTEPLTSRRIALLSGAMVAMFTRGWTETPDFTQNLSQLALQQINEAGGDKASLWIAQWVIGMTTKGYQNVLRSNPKAREDYIRRFEEVIREAADRCKQELGDLRASLGFVEDPNGRRAELGWEDVTRLTTAVGSLTVAIRGSDKSLYGKLFERLVLGSVLSVLGFDLVRKEAITRDHGVFWLSDRRDTREADAVALIVPGQIVRFDIGFIGKGNPEITKDKLSRFARTAEAGERKVASSTFVIVDRLPATLKTKDLAKEIGAEIIEMSMQYWPRELARRLGQRFEFKHELQKMQDSKMSEYFIQKLRAINVEGFVGGVDIEDDGEELEDEEDSSEVE